MGREKGQYDWLARSAKGDPGPVTGGMVGGSGFTPNQAMMRVAIQERTGALAPSAVLSAIEDCEAGGHTHKEPGTPDPHWMYYGMPFGSLLRSRSHAVADAALTWFAVELAMLRAFWTPSGPRLPCARALAGRGKPLRPSWTTATAAAMLLDPSLKRASAAPRPQGKEVLQILVMSRRSFPEILSRSHTVAVHLAVPIRRWQSATQGTFLAMEKETDLYEPCRWMRLDLSGNILDAGRFLEDFTAPTDPPEIIGV